MSASTSRAHDARIVFYAKTGKVHPREVRGYYDSLRWAMVWLTQILFYGACWLSWDGRQALLFDIAERKFYFFGLVLWPQDALLLAILLIISATALFLATAVAGRLFCGFACPQTVYTAIFRWVEARIEGDHLARMRLDQAPAGPRKLALKAAKHASWLAISLWTGITFVGYFTPLQGLLAELAQLSLAGWAAFWVGFYALFTYLQAGFAREMVCQHMCPYSRFQGVMIDADTSTVSYDARRGEPRKAKRAGGAHGDCVDCSLCVQVCPTGIDIREGLQYQCINCGLCVDACDKVMDKVGSPTGLIRFASERQLAGGPAKAVWQRPRVQIYASLLVVFTLLGAWTLSQRIPLLADVLRDRAVLLQEAADGSIENSYTLKLMNLVEAPRRFAVTVDGPAGARLVGNSSFDVPAGSVLPVSVTVAAAPDTSRSGAQPVHFHISAVDDPAVRIVEQSSFLLP